MPRSREQIELSFAPVVHSAAPAVVNVYTRKAMAPSLANPFFSDPFFQFFFRDFERRMPPRQENSLGSGVIIRADGLIVTNHHVIEDADQVMVVLADRREFPAQVVGADREADLALLRIDSARLPALPLGDSDDLEVGDLVLAIGNPFGIGQTVTTVWRRNLEVTLDLSLEPPPFRPAPETTLLDGHHPLSGATIANLSPGLNQDLGLDLFENGVMVLEVETRQPCRAVALATR